MPIGNYFQEPGFFFSTLFVCRKILNCTTVQPFHLNQEFLIVVTQSAQNITKTLHDIFSIILNVGLFNVNVLIEDQSTALWSLHFYMPYAYDCYGFTIFKVGAFSAQNCTNPLNVSIKNLFPSKMSKFHGCPLYVATFSFPPFVIVQQPTDKTGHITYDGIDIILVNHISKTLNLIPKYVQSTDANKRGIVFKNGTATGAFGMVSSLNKHLEVFYLKLISIIVDINIYNSISFTHSGHQRVCKHDRRYACSIMGQSIGVVT